MSRLNDPSPFIWRKKMSRTKLLAAAVGATLLTAGMAQAKLTVALVPYNDPAATPPILQPTYAAASAQDAGLIGKVTYDVRVTVPAGDEYTTSDLIVTTANTTTMYNRGANPSNNRTPTDSDDWSVSPRNEFDTFVSGPPDNVANGFHNTPTILGGAQVVGGNFQETPLGTEVFSATQMSVAYGDTHVDPPGTYTIARITFNKDVNNSGSVVGRVIGTNTAEATTFSFALPVIIPEPTSAAMLAAGIGLVALRRRKA